MDQQLKADSRDAGSLTFVQFDTVLEAWRDEILPLVSIAQFNEQEGA